VLRLRLRLVPDELRLRDEPDELRLRLELDPEPEPERDRDEPEFELERELLDRALLDRAPLDRREVRRPPLARWSRGISAFTTSLTRRFSSASRNLAMRSSSRRIDLASWAVSRSPTSVASASMRL
jgi:hypothetical protein